MNSNKLTSNALDKPILTMRRYANTRHWAVYAGSELLAVVLYRKGAEALLRFFNPAPTR